MLAARIVGRVLSRAASFGFKGALVMMIAGAIEGMILGNVLNLMPRPQTNTSGFEGGGLVMIVMGFATGLIVFAVVGAWTSRHDSTHNLFTKTYRSAIAGSFAGAIIGAICFASLFALLTWWTNGNFLPVPSRAPLLAAGSIQASAFIGYLLGVAVGFFAGTALGAWRGATNAIKQESSTRMETI